MLGMQGTDVVTGFSGTVMGVVDYLTGCRQVLLSPRVDSDGKTQTSEWFDESRVQLDAAVPAIELTGLVSKERLSTCGVCKQKHQLFVDCIANGPQRIGADIAAPGGTRRDVNPKS